MGDISIVWHNTPEDCVRAYWAPVCESEGVPYEDFLRGSQLVGIDENGIEHRISKDAEIEGIRQMGTWGFADTRGRVIHAWADEQVDDLMLIEMLAHEIGHLTGEKNDDQMAEERRADEFGYAARVALSLMRASSLPPE